MPRYKEANDEAVFKNNIVRKNVTRIEALDN